MQTLIGKIVVQLSLLLFITACGGGGSGSGNNPSGSSSSSSGAPVQQQQQALVPSQSELVLFVDEAPTLPSIDGGSGTGAFSYSSSNPDILVVDPDTGELSVVSAGTATITITRAGDANFLETSTSISVTISRREQAPLVFSEQMLSVFVDGTPEEPTLSGGSGEGVVSFISSSPEVATVDLSTGELTIIAAGETTITAENPGDNLYLAADSSYVLLVEKREQETLSFLIDEETYFPDEDVSLPEINGGSGEGALSYSTDNEAVATINSESGEITITGPGTALLSVTKAEDAVFLETQASFSLNIVKREQPALTFETDVLQVLLENGLTSNPVSGGAGEGVVAYASDDESIILINSQSGVINPVSSGNTQVTVTKEGDFVYLPIEASYLVEVKELVQNVVTRIGDSDSILSWSENAAPLELYRYTNSDCDTENYTACNNPNLEIVESSEDLPITDILFSRSQSAFFKLVNSSELAAEYQSMHFVPSLQVQPFANRIGQAIVAYKGKLWITGGTSWDNENSVDVYYNDVWSSEDGAIWTNELENATFGPRAYHQMVVYKNELFLFSGEQPFVNGGTEGTYTAFNNWSTHDGIDWQPHSGPNLPGIDSQAKIIVFNDKLWAIGGGVWSEEYYIWSSEDGRDWEIELESPPFGKRNDHSLVVHNGNLFLYGGTNENGSDNLLTDVWVTANGTEWTLVTADTGFTPRIYSSMFSVNNEIHIVGGYDYTDVAYSTYFSNDNGLTWNLAELSLLPIMYSMTTNTVMNNELWFFSGGTAGLLWTSTDARNWYSPSSNTINWSKN